METSICPHRRRADRRLTDLLRAVADEQAARVDDLDMELLDARIVAAIRASPRPDEHRPRADGPA